MGKIESLAENFHRPRWWMRTGFPYVVETMIGPYFNHFPRDRCEIMEEDWDNLLLLDACRYDMFEQQNNIPGDLSYRISQGSSTAEFFEENFLDSTHHDTIYITANPVPRVEEWCRVDVDSVFYKVIDVWDRHWDEEANTVPPQPVFEAIQNARSEHPHKRILGHFIQPHEPFIGDIGSKMNEFGMTAKDKLTEREFTTREKIWNRLERGEISGEKVWQGYRENLDIVLPHVQRLCNELEGKTVVTSDHGNLVGEFAWPLPIRKYGHPTGIHTKKLVKVPWLEIEAGTRPKIVSDDPASSEMETTEKKRLERLRTLGYY